MAENKNNGTISVNTSANTEIVPDVAEISFAVKTFDAKSMQKCAESIAQKPNCGQ